MISDKLFIACWDKLPAENMSSSMSTSNVEAISGWNNLYPTPRMSSTITSFMIIRMKKWAKHPALGIMVYLIIVDSFIVP